MRLLERNTAAIISLALASIFPLVAAAEAVTELLDRVRFDGGSILRSFPATFLTLSDASWVLAAALSAIAEAGRLLLRFGGMIDELIC